MATPCYESANCMMKWEKLGLIFDPTEHQLPNNCQSFAQAPQVLLFGDFARIYFSTRRLDESNGKYLSHVAYVDMALNFKDVLAVSTHEVISLGKPGCFDEHGIFPLNVMRHAGQIYGYIGGVNRRSSVPVDSAIGIALSYDEGKTFQRLGDGPVLSASLHEPCLIADPFVQVYGGHFHMWYIFGKGWQHFDAQAEHDRVYKIGHAISADGIDWKKNDGREIIASRLGPDECQALPTVIEIAGVYHMFFCYREASDFRHNRERSYRISHASSTDLQNWQRDDNEMSLGLSDAGWDSGMTCYPHVFACQGQIYMLYNGNEFGRHGFGLARLLM